ncbi:hypothetical protein GY45DRAFT_1376271, partial [Cubamyces sp. BRFM 1775]
MSHDGARHVAPLSPPPTLLVEAKELPAEDWTKCEVHGVESWRYGEGPEDGGVPAPPFPPVRDDSGFEEFGSQEGSDNERKLGGSHDDHVMIEPTSVWSIHSPLSISDGLPLEDLPPLHHGLSSSGVHDSLFLSPDVQPGSWAFHSDMSWSHSPSSTLVGGISAPPSPKPAVHSLDGPDFSYSLGLLPTDPVSQHQEPSMISPLDIPYHRDHQWYGDEPGGHPSGSQSAYLPEERHHHPFLSTIHPVSLHPPSDVDLDADFSDTVMPSEDEDGASLQPLSSPRQRSLNDLHETIPPHGDLCPTPAPHSPHGGSLSLPDYDMEDLSEPPSSPHSPH